MGHHRNQGRRQGLLSRGHQDRARAPHCPAHQDFQPRSARLPPLPCPPGTSEERAEKEKGDSFTFQVFVRSEAQFGFLLNSSFSGNPVITLADSTVRDGWAPGTQIIVTTTDSRYDHTELNTVIACSTCAANQVCIFLASSFLSPPDDVRGRRPPRIHAHRKP